MSAGLVEGRVAGGVELSVAFTQASSAGSQMAVRCSTVTV
jgi:hypothetical protein